MYVGYILKLFLTFCPVSLLFFVDVGSMECSPLHLAVLYGFSDCCRKLLSSGLLHECLRLEHLTFYSLMLR